MEKTSIMRSSILLLSLFLTLPLSSCEKGKYESLIGRMWIVKSIIQDGQEFEKGAGIVILNSMNFDSNFHCEMPMLIADRRSATGKWRISEENGEFYLTIFDNDVEFYNDKYVIKVTMNKPIKEIVLTSTSKDFSMRCQGVETI